MSESPGISSRQSSGESSMSSLSTFSTSPKEFCAASTGNKESRGKSPFKLDLVRTCVLLGFTETRATRIWNRYVSQPHDMGADVMDFALWEIKDPSVPDVETSTDDWNSCMDSLGIDDRLKKAIMIEEFEDLRYTASCKYWLLDAIENVLGHLRLPKTELESTSSRLSSRIPTLSNLKGRKQTPYTQPFEANAEEPSSSSQPRNPNKPENLITLQSATTPSRSPTIALHTSIWKSMSRAKADTLLNKATGNINLGPILTIPGDFNGGRKVAYWSLQKETAERYAKWAKHKYPMVDISVIQAFVPEKLLRRLTVVYIWFSEDWKRVVWHGRNGEWLPRELAQLEDTDLLIGHIASGKHFKYMAMKDHTQMKEGDVLPFGVDTEPKKAIQWVFQTRKAMESFESMCRGKVHIHQLSTSTTIEKPPGDDYDTIGTLPCCLDTLLPRPNFAASTPCCSTGHKA